MKKAPVAACIWIAVATILSSAVALGVHRYDLSRSLTARMAGDPFELAKVICIKKTDFPNARFNAASDGERTPAVNCTKTSI